MRRGVTYQTAIRGLPESFTRESGPTGRGLGATLPLRDSTQATYATEIARLRLHLAHSRTCEIFMHEQHCSSPVLIGLVEIRSSWIHCG